jgi:hypothetical protein
VCAQSLPSVALSLPAEVSVAQSLSSVLLKLLPFKSLTRSYENNRWEFLVWG